MTVSADDALAALSELAVHGALSDLDLAYDFGEKAHLEDGEVVLDFGQHEGEALGDVPTGYLQWLIGEDFPQDLLDEAEDELLGRFDFDD